MAVNPISLANLEKGRAARAKKPIRVNVSLKPSTHERLKKLPLNVSASIDRIVEWVATAGKVEEIFLESRNTHNGIEASQQGLDIQDTHNRIQELQNEKEALRAELRSQLSAWQLRLTRVENILADTNALLLRQYDENRKLQGELTEARSQLSLNQQSKTDLELPDAAILLNQLKAKRKKSKTDLQDVEAILELIEQRS